jgi:hypothetical protein
VVATCHARSQGLDKVANALVERLAFKMTVVATANLGAEREIHQQERLQALLQAEKRRAQAPGGGSTQAAALVVVEYSERPSLLKQVYKRADILSRATSRSGQGDANTCGEIRASPNSDENSRFPDTPYRGQNRL